MNMHATKGTDLAVMEVLTPAMVFAPGGVDDVISKIKAEVQTVVADISTDAGRKAIASTAYKIARSKTALDKMGKDLGENHHKAWKAITTERSRIATELDALKDEFRKPLTDWENAEKDRVAAHELALEGICENPLWGPTETSADIRKRLQYLENYPARDWQEFSARAAAALKDEIDRARQFLATAEKREAEAAELARFRQEQIEREQREREERIALEAAERAKTEAERKAREEAARIAAIAENERLRVEREKAQAERLGREAVERAEQAAERAREDAEKAIQNERLRVERERATADRETARREADKKHRAKINNAAREALVAAGLTDEQAICAVGAIARGEVPSVKISY